MIAQPSNMRLMVSALLSCRVHTEKLVEAARPSGRRADRAATRGLTWAWVTAGCAQFNTKKLTHLLVRWIPIRKLILRPRPPLVVYGVEILESGPRTYVHHSGYID